MTRKGVSKYKDEEHRKQVARERASAWYYSNKDKAKNRIAAWQKTDHGRAMRKAQRSKYNNENPLWWRIKKKRDKTIRRSREFNAGTLSVSSLVLLEHTNIVTFKNSFFTCEYCRSIIGENYSLEHIVPLSRNGTNDLCNLAVACSRCNLNKGNKTLSEWKPELLSYITERNEKWKITQRDL